MNTQKLATLTEGLPNSIAVMALETKSSFERCHDWKYQKAKIEEYSGASIKIQIRCEQLENVPY